MSDFHVLERTEGRLTLVMHFKVPNSRNSGGVPVRQILATEARPSTLPTISAEEAAMLADGRLVERNVQISIRGLDEEEILRAIERKYARTRQNMVESFKLRYSFWGVEGNVE